jgi:hypothetical protein
MIYKVLDLSNHLIILAKVKTREANIKLKASYRNKQRVEISTVIVLMSNSTDLKIGLLKIGQMKI